MNDTTTTPGTITLSSFTPGRTSGERLLPTHIIAGMLDLAIRNNIPSEALLKEVGIDPSTIGESNAYLSGAQVSGVVFALYQKLEDPAFGLHLGESVHRSIHAIAGDLFSSSESLRQAFNKLVLYQDLLIPFVELDIIESEKYIDLTMEVFEGDFNDLLKSGEAMALYAVSSEIIASGIWCTAKQFLSNDSALLEAGFRHPEPKYAREYQSIFKCPVVFEQSRTYLRISRALFDKTLYGALPEYHKKAEQKVELRLRQLKKSEAILNSVKSFVKEHISNKELSLENTARQLHMTGRTLQRALKMENTSFIDIRDSVRSELAKHYLENTHISIEEISVLVGFADASGFYTAFKRWYGVSPGSFRKTNN